MEEAIEVENGPASLDDMADSAEPRGHYDAERAIDREIMVYRISGAFFFGATARVLQALERVGATPRIFVLDFTDVPLIDSTAARSLVAFVNKLRRAGTAVYFTAARKNVHRVLNQAGLKPPLVSFAASTADVTTKNRI